MTPEQKKMARHALGLDGSRRQSYRNRYCVGPGCTGYDAWVAMVAAGHATRVTAAAAGASGDMFYLTRQGADAVLWKNEKLDPEDFPVTDNQAASAAQEAL